MSSPPPPVGPVSRPRSISRTAFSFHPNVGRTTTNPRGPQTFDPTDTGVDKMPLGDRGCQRDTKGDSMRSRRLTALGGALAAATLAVTGLVVGPGAAGAQSNPYERGPA